MPESLFATDAPKRPTNVSINADLLRQARALGIDLSRALEEKLVELICERRRTAWLEANRAGIDAYNARIAQDGLFGDEWRTFWPEPDGVLGTVARFEVHANRSRRANAVPPPRSRAGPLRHPVRP